MTTSTQWHLAREAAERYEQVVVPTILGPMARALVRRAALRRGEAVLDVGCGTGAATRPAAEMAGRSGRVIGVDVNAAMIDVARSLPPVPGAMIEWLESSAYRLPLEAAAVDVVLCAQTLQFLTEPAVALAEMRRVLRPGGRVAISVWADLRDNPYFSALVYGVTRYVGAETAAGLVAAFALSAPGAIRTLLVEAGFKQIKPAATQLDLPLPVPEQFVPRHIHATPMAMGFNAAGPSMQQAVIRAVSERLAAYRTDGGARVPFKTHLVTANT